jgi:hypothetical protein
MPTGTMSSQPSAPPRRRLAAVHRLSPGSLSGRAYPSAVPPLQLDHVAVAVKSIRAAVPLYRDALGGEYLMGGDGGGT